MPTISVVVPVYNAADKLEACIDSILSQTFADFEVILVDDGSTDRCPAICDRYAGDDNRVACVHQANQGQSSARLSGVRMAGAPWVTFVDSDDALAADALQKLLSVTDEDTDIVIGNGQSLNGWSSGKIPAEDFRQMAVRGEGQIGLVWGCLYRRHVLTERLFDLPYDIRMGEDYIFWLRLAFSADKPVAVLHDNVYRKGDDTCSSQFVWTAAFAQRIHQYRLDAIPPQSRQQYMHGMIEDRLANLFAVAVCRPRSDWQHSDFYKQLLADIRSSGYVLPMRKKLFLCLPARRLRRLYSLMGRHRLS